MQVKDFGVTKSGEVVKSYCLTNNKGMEVVVINYGAIIHSIIVPDKNGNPTDVVLGYDTVLEYEDGDGYFGAAIGRSSNRINQAKCVIDGVTYELEVNDNENNLHSGTNGIHAKVFDVVENGDNSVTMTVVSKDMEQGFPGNLTIEITYVVTDDNALDITYKATTDKTTTVNLTNHSYFNLEGHASGNIEGQTLQFNCSAYTPVVDGKAIPTGEIAKVAGTPMDFTESKTIGRDINADFEQLHFTGGYDHNFVIDGADGSMRVFAVANAAGTGITMEASTDLPGVQLYAGNFIGPKAGKGGVSYDKRQGFCLETQYFPNSANEEGFEIAVVKPGEVYTTKTSYKFS